MEWLVLLFCLFSLGYSLVTCRRVKATVREQAAEYAKYCTTCGLLKAETDLGIYYRCGWDGGPTYEPMIYARAGSKLYGQRKAAHKH